MTAAPASHRIRLPLAAAFSALALLGLSACGGGDELAPPDPQVEGPGMAIVRLDGVEVGSTPLVTSGLASTREPTLREPAERVTFEGDPPTAVLSRQDLAPSPTPNPGNPPAPCTIQATQVADPSIVYDAGVDFTIDANNGRLIASSDGMGGYFVPDGTEVDVNYCYFVTVYSVDVGIALPEADYFALTFHNLPAGQSGMATTSALSENAPGDGSFAFYATAAQDLTILGGARFTAVNDPAVNQATLVAVDLRNVLNPCMEGSVTALVSNDATGEESVLEVDFDDPDCPL